MKVSTLALLLAFAACTDAFSQAPEQSGHGIEFLPQDRKAPVAPAVSAADLKKRQAAEKFGGFAAEETLPKGWDLADHSEFIAFDGNVTLLPKGAIIHVPDRFKANVVAKMEGNLMLWNEFVARYPGLVSRMDVSIEEASGTTPLKPERLQAERVKNLIIVGVLNRNPITVSRAAITPVTTPSPR